MITELFPKSFFRRPVKSYIGKVVTSYETIYVQTAFYVKQEQFCTCPAVTAGIVMIQADIQVPADSIKFMVWELRQTYAAHTACACIIGIGVPADFIMAEAFCQNSHIKLRIMGNQETAAHD